MNRWRIAALILGVATVISGFVFWLIPTSPAKTTSAEKTTTTVIGSAGHKTITAVTKSTTTTGPGAARSDAMLVAVLTFGVGLLIVASLWNRIQELTIGGVSIKLTETVAEPAEIAVMDAATAPVDMLGPTSAGAIAAEVYRISEHDQGLVCVDLRQGDRWAPANLSMFILLLASRSHAEVVIFTGQGSAGPETYFGAASVARLADRLAAEDPALSAAHRATEMMSPTPPTTVGEKFFERLTQQDPSRATQSERVNQTLLERLTKPALITASVDTKGEQIMSMQQQRAILAFPLSYVPITNRGHLDAVVRKERLAEKVALATVGL